MDYYYGIYGGRYPYILDRDVLNYCGIADGDSVRLVVTDVNGTMWELDVEAENRYYTLPSIDRCDHPSAHTRMKNLRVYLPTVLPACR